ncbi:hypothetical protein [Flavobacterium sp. HNIBRBA15423]|uniref:hypothetical protein n=1 Tax=Flavobacterium sp. HNIBRBA15423 TaxID=3458683 RepID=UPI004043C4F1
MTTIDTCFSRINFDIVYNYIEEQIKTNNTKYYIYDNSKKYKSAYYELYLKDTTTIYIKNNESRPLAVISKEKGIHSLVIWGNKRMVNKSHQMFCDVLSEAIKNKKQSP